METLSFFLLAAVLGGVVAVGSLVRKTNAALDGMAARLHLMQVEVSNLNAPLGDVRASQEKVLNAILAYREDVAGLLKEIRDLNKAEMVEKREILTQENIRATSRITQARDWMSKLEAAAEKEFLGFGSSR